MPGLDSPENQRPPGSWSDRANLWSSSSGTAARLQTINGIGLLTDAWLVVTTLNFTVSRDAAQKGSYVGPDKLTFDFSSAALTKQQVRDVEKLVNEKVVEGSSVSWTEIPYSEAKQRKDIQQFTFNRRAHQLASVE